MPSPLANEDTWRRVLRPCRYRNVRLPCSSRAIGHRRRRCTRQGHPTLVRVQQTLTRRVGPGSTLPPYLATGAAWGSSTSSHSQESEESVSNPAPATKSTSGCPNRWPLLSAPTHSHAQGRMRTCAAAKPTPRRAEQVRTGAAGAIPFARIGCEGPGHPRSPRREVVLDYPRPSGVVLEPGEGEVLWRSGGDWTIIAAVRTVCWVGWTAGANGADGVRGVVRGTAAGLSLDLAHKTGEGHRGVGGDRGTGLSAKHGKER